MNDPLLIQHGGNVNEKDDDSLTPLHYAAMRGNVSATKQLLRCPNIDIEVNNNNNHLEDAKVSEDDEEIGDSDLFTLGTSIYELVKI